MYICCSGHRPFYSSSEENNAASVAQRDFFFPVLSKFDIDLIFVGHIHYYERTYPMNYTDAEVCSTSYINPSCPVYIVSGASGNIEGLSHANTTRKFSAFKDESYGIGILSIYN